MKKSIKRILGTALTVTTLCSLLPFSVGAKNGDSKYIAEVLDNQALAQKYDTSVFEGEHVYLLEENFLECNDGQINSDARPNGWDIDRRGGRIRSDGTRICIGDGDNTLGVSMKHDLMPHKSGDLVLETAIHMKWAPHSGYSIKLNGNGQNVVELVTKDSYVNYINADGTETSVGLYVKEKDTPVKVVVHPEAGTCDVIVNGQVTMGLKLRNNVGVIDQVELKTSEADEMTVSPVFCHVYINHFVNERFLTTPIGGTPYNFTRGAQSTGDTGVAVMESQRVDVNSYTMSSSKFLGASELSTTFTADVNRLAVEAYMLIPKKHDGIKMQLMGGNSNVLTIETKGEDFTVGGNVIYQGYKTNLWNRFKVIADYQSKTADVYLNYNLVAENVPINGKIDKLSFTSGASDGAVLWVDDILAYEDIDTPAGYPEAPEVVEPKEGYNVGMLMYSMWREGFHFGWDRMSPYDERTPYMGYYTEGMAETADWETKWLYEHGVNFQIFTFSGVPRNTDAPVKKPTRAQALIDGLLVAKYKMDFCIMWSTPNEQTIRGLEDFKNNILPYWVENYFKNPNYLAIDNKLVVYSYSTDAIMKCLGGESNMDIALTMMNDEAKKLGYDGVMFIQNGNALPATLVEKHDIYRYTYSWGGAADDGEAVIKTTTLAMENPNDTRYIPSICQGYNTTPWRVGNVGFMTPEEMNMMLETVSTKSDEWLAMGNKMAKTVTLTCWNEWGEGHFYSPSKLYGFDYMNAVRNHFTTAGEKAQENFPTEQSFVRMNVLYPLGRKALKLMNDQVAREVREEELVLLEAYDFSNPADYARLEAEKSVDSMENKDGMLVARSTVRDPSIFINNVNIDAKKAKAIKITAAQEHGSAFTIYYQTSVDGEMGKNNKRFDNAFEADPTLTLKTVTLSPADTNKLRGRITRLRIDPDDNVNGEFRVKRIEIWGNAESETGLFIDGKEYFNNTPVRQVNGTSYMSIFKYFYATKNYNVEWDALTGHMHIDTWDKAIDLYAGKNEYTINGVQKTFTNAPFAADGNLFVPIREFFTELGYEIGWNADEGAVTLTSPGYAHYIASNPAPLTFEFNSDEYLEGWKVENNYRGYKVKDGVLRLSSRADPLSITQTGLGIKGSNVKYAIIRIKNTSSSNTLRLYFTNDLVKSYGKDGAYYIAATTNDTEFKEYVVPLSGNVNFNGNIDNLRFDVPTNDGSAEIDYIRFVESVN